MTADEYCCYSLIILMADHRTGTWIGSSQALSAITRWSIRQCQVLIKSLRGKGYVEGECRRGVGNYRIKVIKYFRKEAHGDAQLPQRSASPCVTTPKEAHGDATLQEERLQEETHNKKPAQTQREHSLERVRQIEAKQTRLSKESAAKQEAKIVESPRGSVKEGYQEFIDLRSAGRLPQGMTWKAWQELSAEDRQSILAGNVVAIRKAL